MSTSARFNELLEAIDKLAPEDQEALINIVERRRVAQRRAALVKDIEEARRDFQAGQCIPRTTKDLMPEIFHESTSARSAVFVRAAKNRKEKSAGNSKHRGRS